MPAAEATVAGWPQALPAARRRSWFRAEPTLVRWAVNEAILIRYRPGKVWVPRGAGVWGSAPRPWAAGRQSAGAGACSVPRAPARPHSARGAVTRFGASSSTPSLLIALACWRLALRGGRAGAWAAVTGMRAGGGGPPHAPGAASHERGCAGVAGAADSHHGQSAMVGAGAGGGLAAGAAGQHPRG